MGKIVNDPFGNEILIRQTVLDLNEHVAQSEDIFDDMSMVIEKPIMLFKMKEGPTQFYYLRAIGWNKTMLIGVQQMRDRLEVVNYEIDPSIDRINKLHRNGERLI